jgi:hypothetical protein
MLSQIREPHSLQLGEDPIFKLMVVLLREGVVRIDRRNVGENFQIVASLGSFRRVGSCRCDQINRWIFR